MSCLSHADRHAFHKNGDQIETETQICQPLELKHSKYRLLLSSAEMFLAFTTKSVDQVQTAPVGAQWLNGRVLDSRPRGRGVRALRASLRCGP